LPRRPGSGLALLAGDTLVHLDMRADNVLLGEDGAVWFVDWPWTCRGARWVDSALLVLNAATYGHDPEELVAANPLLSAADPIALTALLVGLAGMFAECAGGGRRRQGCQRCARSSRPSTEPC
jgi:hypothetical protein